MNDKDKTLRQYLLEQAADKPIRKFRQFDVFWNETPDSMVQPDEDGDWICAGQAYELRRTGILRVYVPAGSNPVDTIRSLKKVIAWIEKDPELITDHWGYDETREWGENKVIEPERGVTWPYAEREDSPVKTLDESNAALLKQKAELHIFLENKLTALDSVRENLRKALEENDFDTLHKLASEYRRLVQLEAWDEVPF